jgi:hypothetical protein
LVIVVEPQKPEVGQLLEAVGELPSKLIITQC